jgi:NitT/TauT family transport system substrate-binding protein
MMGAMKAALLVLGLAFVAEAPVLAEGARLDIGSSAGTDSTVVFVAAEEGIFARHGLDAKVTLIPLMPNLPAAVLSNSVQIGFMTGTTFLQAAGGGLDLVAVEGGSVTSHQTTNIAFMAATGSGVHSAKDLVGRTVGIPGLGAFMHVTFCYWLGEQGVDFRKVKFQETTFSSMRDMLRAGTVQAVGVMDPYAKSISESDTGYVVSQFLSEVPEGKPVALFVAVRDWAVAHPELLKPFRDSIADSVQFMKDHPDKARADFGKFVKLPPAALAASEAGVYQPEITQDQLKWWIDVMDKQDLLHEKLDPARLIVQ